MATNPIQPQTSIVYQYFIALRVNNNTVGGINAIAWNGERTLHDYRTFKQTGPNDSINSLEIDEVYPGHVTYTGTLKGVSFLNGTINGQAANYSVLQNFIKNTAGGFDVLQQTSPADISVMIFKATDTSKPVYTITLKGVWITKTDIEFDLTSDDPMITQELPFTFGHIEVTKS